LVVVVFAIYNNLKRFPATKQARKEAYDRVINNNHGKASECVECMQCQEHCPQHIDITEWLKVIAKEFE